MIEGKNGTVSCGRIGRRIHPGAKPEREIITTALGLADAVKQKADAIRGDRRLSQAGVSAKIVEVALAEWPNLQQQRGKAEAIAADIAKRRTDMASPPADPTNVADAIFKSELRTMLRTSTRADRLRLARDDNAFAVAALTAPPILSGFDSKTIGDLDMVRTAYQQRNFTELYAGLELRDEALGVVNMAIKSATDQILEEAGIAESEVGSLTSKADADEVYPDNLPKITRAELSDWQANDPSRAADEMKRVFNGRAHLVES